MGRQIDSPAQDSSLELGGTVSPVAPPAQHLVQVGHKEKHRAGVGAQGLLEAQVPGLVTEVALSQQFKTGLLRGVAIGTRFQVFNPIGYQVCFQEAGLARR